MGREALIVLARSGAPDIICANRRAGEIAVLRAYEGRLRMIFSSARCPNAINLRWLLLVLFWNLVMNVPKCMNQGCFEEFPCLSILASRTGHDERIDRLNPPVFVKDLARLVHGRSRWSTRPLRCCPDVNDTRLQARSGFVGFVCEKDVRHLLLLPLPASDQR
jgi:hypothetical protein